ncbi:MAG: PA2169 family four-helix-bundle protein [Bacteroidota bacterium]
MDKSKIIAQLNRLLVLNKDAQKGYTELGNISQDVEMKRWLFDHAKMRATFVRQLEKEIRFMDGNPADSSSLLSELHRFWMDLKNKVTSDDIGIVIDEAMRGEQKALEDFKDVLASTDMPENLRRMILGQYDTVRNSMKTLEQLQVIHE